VNTKGAVKAGYPFSYVFRAQQPSTNLDKALWFLTLPRMV